jgi:hypothetical protein
MYHITTTTELPPAIQNALGRGKWQAIARDMTRGTQCEVATQREATILRAALVHWHKITNRDVVSRRTPAKTYIVYFLEHALPTE